ncbi:lysophospholipid acyltransferase family protein [Ferrimonas aestuarii]|uniref:L-ornithine N(alpha)-acyltransferase n=1 Tax=Ferrimonas aestuarii TaxID=2569539 RepID=A0A4U1BLU3_9GAMM|nr:lysophospholipid acyltransferase family protein [Ferrimonas aestuarii]TKB54268.1 GNAT family N-acetyltransferase [Ferrimonas aestuarii]
MIQVDTLVSRHFPNLPAPKLVTPLLKRLVKEQQFHDFAKQYPDCRGFEFVDKVLEFLNFDCRLEAHQLAQIPASGRVVIIANHPIGSLDGLGLLQQIGRVRKDVRIVANVVLNELEPLTPLLCPVNVFERAGRSQYQSICQHLEDNGVVIFFPAGEVSRLTAKGVKDGSWRKGFLRAAKECRAPILPIRIEAKCSWLFYGLSSIYRPIGTAMLVQEMFKLQHKSLIMHVGDLIPNSAIEALDSPMSEQLTLFKQHLYRLGTPEKGLLPTHTAIADAECKDQIEAQLAQSQLLGHTADGMQIFVYQGGRQSPLMRELGRCRELAFRAVGEGSGNSRDLDAFDDHYFQLILWNPSKRQIVGAYRMGDAAKPNSKLYSATLFQYLPGMTPYLHQGLELGRSFVMPEYWGKRALDSLWQGIGAFLAANPQYRYLFGAVSVSAQLPVEAKDLLIGFYQRHFSPPANEPQKANHRTPYQSRLTPLQLESIFCGDYQSDFKTLKQRLKQLGVTVPTLYKQYGELCDKGGVQFIDFGIDPDFSDCIDGLVLIDTHKLKLKRRRRYISPYVH